MRQKWANPVCPVPVPMVVDRILKLQRVLDRLLASWCRLRTILYTWPELHFSWWYGFSLNYSLLLTAIVCSELATLRRKVQNHSTKGCALCLISVLQWLFVQCCKVTAQYACSKLRLVVEQHTMIKKFYGHGCTGRPCSSGHASVYFCIDFVKHCINKIVPYSQWVCGWYTCHD